LFGRRKRLYIAAGPADQQAVQATQPLHIRPSIYTKIMSADDAATADYTFASGQQSVQCDNLVCLPGGSASDTAAAHGTIVASL
jgi:hypothetical protein